mmetsp:Transcript_25169/g.35261  ORF Transcript_25169/g.35261 Transcript_25169/m.35261 type:complete len:407 (-) Transcript_25169:46-1266(-)
MQAPKIQQRKFQKFFSFLCIIGGALFLILFMDIAALMLVEEHKDYHELAVVYTWVNGSDPEYIKQRMTHPPPGTLVNVGANRWRDNNELRFSLRSLHMYAPWVKKIYILINDNTQPPNWLNTTHPKIEVAYVGQMLSNSSAFPIFNSNVLELNLFNIPGLTDNFLYMNDDFYFMQPTKPSLFLTKEGYPKFFYTPEVSPTKHDTLKLPTQYQLVFQRTNEILDKSFGYHERRIASHAPYVYSKAAWNEIYQHYGPLLNETLSHRYRQADDINSHHLHHYYIIHTADQRHKKRTGHVPVQEWNSTFEEEVPVAQPSSSAAPTTRKKMGYYNYPLWWTWLNVEFVRGGADWFMPSLYKIWRPYLICINDDYDGGVPAARHKVQNFLLDSFPEASPFERADAPPLVFAD